MDQYQDLRSEMILTMERLGIEVEIQHHEVGTAGQAEIDMRFDTLLRMADKLMLYKYVVKNVAWAHNLSATFMPKPIFQDNGSGMHCHQSLWKGGEPLFFSETGYAGLSDMARWYIGGVAPPPPVDKDLYDLPPEEMAAVPQVPGSLEEALAALEADQDYLLAGSVFTPDLIETWITYKREREIDEIRLRPHPWEFYLYYDI